MSSLLTRNLRSMKILQKHNFTEEEAQEVLDTLQGVSATKEDLNKTESKLSRDLLKAENKLEKQISLVREDLVRTEGSLKNEILNNKIEITSIKTELKEEIHTLDKKIDQVASILKDQITQTSSSQLKWIFGMLFTILIAMVGLLKL